MPSAALRNVVVMEGYTDTIVARQFGFDNTVAVLGHGAGRTAHSIC